MLAFVWARVALQPSHPLPLLGFLLRGWSSLYQPQVLDWCWGDWLDPVNRQGGRGHRHQRTVAGPHLDSPCLSSSLTYPFLSAYSLFLPFPIPSSVSQRSLPAATQAGRQGFGCYHRPCSLLGRGDRGNLSSQGPWWRGQEGLRLGAGRAEGGVWKV